MKKISDSIYKNKRELYTIDGEVFILIFDGSWWKDIVVATDGLGNILRTYHEDCDINGFETMKSILDYSK